MQHRVKSKGFSRASIGEVDPMPASTRGALACSSGCIPQIHALVCIADPRNDDTHVESSKEEGRNRQNGANDETRGSRKSPPVEVVVLIKQLER